MLIQLETINGFTSRLKEWYPTNSILLQLLILQNLIHCLIMEWLLLFIHWQKISMFLELKGVGEERENKYFIKKVKFQDKIQGECIID